MGITDEESDRQNMKNTPRKIYIITQKFPFGYGEKTFIEPELNMLIESGNFDITIICNPKEEEKMTSKIRDFVKVIRIPYRDVFESPGACIKYGFKFITTKVGWKEIMAILGSKGDKIGRLLNSIWFYMQSSCFAEDLLKKVDISDGIVYTYWFYTQNMGMLLNMHKFHNVKFISRIHGFDLYNEMNPYGRQPFRWYMDDKMEKIFFIAQKGKEYYQSRWGEEGQKEKYELCRLGTFCNDSLENIRKTQIKANEFLLVSCSNIIPLKRVELIIEALVHISDFEVKWVHFGDGTERDKVEQKASQLLREKKNVTYHFEGQRNNQEIIEFYRKNLVDCFITTSSSEGCPVSIQEALAYGIPIIATDVGEIPLMIEENGFLLSKAPSSVEISNAIISLYKKSQSEKEMMRETSRRIWEEKFNGATNYRVFIECLSKM